MNVTESTKFQSITADTALFVLRGGRFGITANGTWNSGNVKLLVLGPDRSTMLPTGVSLTADSYATVDLPPGQYQFQLNSVTSVSLAITTIPF